VHYSQCDGLSCQSEGATWVVSAIITNKMQDLRGWPYIFHYTSSSAVSTIDDDHTHHLWRYVIMFQSSQPQHFHWQFLLYETVCPFWTYTPFTFWLQIRGGKPYLSAVINLYKLHAAASSLWLLLYFGVTLMQLMSNSLHCKHKWLQFYL